MADDDSVVVCRGEIVGRRFLRLGSSFYGGSTLVFSGDELRYIHI